MKGYLSPEQGGAGSIPLDSRTEVYRDPEEGQAIAAETDTGVSYLDIADVTVSRKQGETAPVVFVAHSESIEVRNQGNANGVVVRTDGETREVEEGFSERVRRDAVIELGFQTELRLIVEREARVEVQDGDYVAGNKTEVTDSVLNRSNVGGGQPADAPSGQSQGGRVEDGAVNRSDIAGDVEDSVVNRSTVGAGTGEDSSTTRNVCQVHGITYTGQTCPKCAAAESSGETKYCLYCGESIPELARVCPRCGEDLPGQ